MSDFSPFFLERIGYANFSPERKLAFEKSLDELGYCIRAARSRDMVEPEKFDRFTGSYMTLGEEFSQ